MLYKTENPHGGDIYKETMKIDFSANINPLGTPVSVKKAIINTIDEIDRYPDPYCRELVRDIATFEGVPEEGILCGNGAAELIYSYCEALLPKKAMETAPTFSEYSAALEKIQCNVIRHELLRDKEFELDESFLEHLKTEKPEVLFLCNPNNPTGRLVPKHLMEKTAALCQELGIHIFVDECFLDFTERGFSMKEFLEEYPNLFMLKAFTKNYGMAGVRLGYCMCSDEVLLKRMSKTVQPWNVSSVAQSAGRAALNESEFLKRSREYISNERRWLKENLETLGFWVCPSDANYLLFYGRNDLDGKLRKYGISIRNCSNYHGLDAGWFRTAVRLHEENEILINSIKEICEKE